MFQPSREQVRRFFCGAWQKFKDNVPLQGAERTAAAVIVRHPEYHQLLSHGDSAVAREWTPEGGQMNPFLHLSLHLALEEQIAIDQPAGIRDLWQEACRRTDDPHQAAHCFVECLAETLWQAGGAVRPHDGSDYLARVRQKLQLGGGA